LDLTGFENSLKRADLVLTGEGSIDRQTLQGKAPFGVARRAKEKSIRVIAFAGIIPPKADHLLARYFDELISINPESLLPEKALGLAFQNLEKSAYELGKRLA
jgi:glycerate kinase